ncbi:hypothetical protein ACQKII_05300 [Lysinibacillus sp. NPDC048646]|uniref:hypothetical protein n=1 Tax=Lysinibacillus sp. NPDC048646 TaxID=3390574 RepID=UPI003D007AA9
MTETKQLSPETEFYTKWLGIMDTKLMCLQNNRNEYLIDKIDERIIKYLSNNCLEKDWKNQLLLIALVNIARNIDAMTNLKSVKKLNVRFKDIFEGYNIDIFSRFNPGIHLYGYLKGEICFNASNRMKSELLSTYRADLYYPQKWIENNLTLDEQLYYKQFLLPPISFDSRDFPFTKLAIQEAQDIRKNETDAIVPHLPTIRAEANLRWNQMKRLRDAFQQQIKIVEADSISLPIEFSYAEPKRIGEVFYFRLWDKPSFVLNHQKEFSETVIKRAKQCVVKLFLKISFHYLLRIAKDINARSKDLTTPR